MYYDVIIVGAGPAGLEAAITLKIREKKVLLLGKISEKIEKAPLINNYLGFPEISGSDLKQHFLSHLDKLNLSINDEIVKSVYKLSNSFIVQTSKTSYEANSVIIATGVNNYQSIKGEQEFLGRGISYCATCDGSLFKNKRVVVLGYNEESIKEKEFLEGLASKVDYFRLNKNSEKKPFEIKGGIKADTLVFDDGSTINADGFFILKDALPLSNLVPGLKTDGAHIIVNRNMETNIKGLYACGDVTGLPYQYMKACGEGVVAALNAIKKN